MDLRQRFEDRIRKKEQEIQSLESQLGEAKAYIQAMQDALKLLPRENGKEGTSEGLLKPGSAVYKSMQLLKNSGRPMHIVEILQGIGEQNTKKLRLSLGGSLARYVRNKQVFTRTRPNTFGLMSMQDTSEEPPDDFGISDEK